MEKIPTPVLKCQSLGCPGMPSQECNNCKQVICKDHLNICNHDSFRRILVQLDEVEASSLEPFIYKLISSYNKLYVQKSEYFSELIQKLSNQMHEELSQIAENSSYLASMLNLLKSSKSSHIQLKETGLKYASWDLLIENSSSVFPDYSSHLKTCFEIHAIKNHFVELSKLSSNEDFLQDQGDYLKSSGFSLYSHLNEVSHIVCGEKFCASLSYEDSNIKVWELESGKLLKDLVFDEKVSDMEIDPFIESLVVGLSSNFIEIHQFSLNEEKRSLIFDDFEAIRCIKAGQSRKILGNNKCQILVLDKDYLKLSLITPPNEKRPVVAISINEPANLFAVAPASNNVLIFQLIPLSLKQTLRLKGNSKCLGFHLNQVVLADESNKISFMNPESGRVEKQLRFDSFYTCRNAEIMLLWNSSEISLNQLRSGSETSSVIQDIRVSKCSSNCDGTIVFLVDENMRLLIMKNGELTEMPGHSSVVSLIHYSKTSLVTCSYSEVIIWDIQTQQQLKKFNLDTDVEEILQTEETLILRSSAEIEIKLSLATLEII